MLARTIRYIRYLCLLLCCYPAAENFGQPNDHGLLWPPYGASYLPDTTTIKAELNQAVQLTDNFPDSARKVTMIAYQKSKTIAYHFGMGWALNILGKIDQNAGAYDASILHLQEAIPHLHKSGSIASIAVPYINIGNAYFYKGNYSDALQNYYRALNTMQEYERPVSSNDSTQAYLNIAFIWDKIGGLSQATAALKKVETIAYLYKDTFLLVQFYGNAAKIYTHDSTQLALQYLRKAVVVAKEKKLNGELMGSLNSIASAYNFLHQPDSALLYLGEVKSILNHYPGAYNYHRFHYQNQLGHALLLKKGYKEAERILVPLYQEIKMDEQSDILMSLEKNMVELYEATGKDRQALHHAQNYANMVQELYEQRNSKVTALWLQLLAEENNKALVTKELHITQQQRTIQQKNFWILGITIGLILLAAAMIAFIRTYRQKQKIQQATIVQLQQEQEISQLKAQISGEEQERNRIAIELHDNVGGLLTTATYSLQTLDRQHPSEYGLQKIDALIKEVSHEIRNTSHRLMPDVLLRQDLSDAAIQYCAFVERNTGLHIDIQIQGTFEHVPQEIQLSYFRILQELLQNTLKHARAKKILVQLHASRSIISLTVEDDGIGFNKQADQSMGKGFKNIENRLKIWNGHINYESSPNAGTSVYVEVSLDTLGAGSPI